MFGRSDTTVGLTLTVSVDEELDGVRVTFPLKLPMAEIVIDELAH